MFFWLRVGGGCWLVATQILESPFSAVSKLVFAIEVAFFSMLQDLHDWYAFAPLQKSRYAVFRMISEFRNIWY